LGLGSPPSPCAVPSCSSSVLCSATTAIVLLGSLHLSLASRYLACFLPLCVPLPARWMAKAATPAPGLLLTRYPFSSGIVRKETSGSHKFPSYPFGRMPRSHQTPVESWPLALAQPGLLPSAACKASALAPCQTPQEVILLSTTILISGLNNAACILPTSRLRTSIAGLVRGFVTDLLARLWSGGT